MSDEAKTWIEVRADIQPRPTTTTPLLVMTGIRSDHLVCSVRFSLLPDTQSDSVRLASLLRLLSDALDLYLTCFCDGKPDGRVCSIHKEFFD